MLTRVKTFVATGVATAGRLYAGDLNAIQDAVAAQSDYAQRVDAATFGIGETGLALLHYGTLEARITGALRTDAILRGLGGLYAGQLTTTARDALATGVGLTPYGLIIFNTTTNRYEWNKGNDTTRNWQPISGVVVEKNGAGPFSEGGINFIEGSGITLTIADNTGTGFADVTISAPASAVAGVVPIGGMCDYGGLSDPPNFLICDGRSLLRAGTYANLFNAIQTGFGFADGTHFNIPDRRSRVGVGVGTKVAIGANEGLTVAQRNVSHYHSYDSADNLVGGYTSSGVSPAHVTPGHNTTGDTANIDSPAYLGVNVVIRYQ